ncbi:MULTISPECIES: hypothetical protein [unclassified Sulfitobacter]|uniref:hypothetical protein n=1 Tax=unclassified Sulfitobacter TaxID=196795 RepID=UPI0007C39B93|nr:MULTISPECIES: hypothetical protein [unclassified Sulfitobacter]KZY53467.1 hypothetical protein A3734_15430 [Sulfitobacter sp. HI0054]TKA84213.1 hypothetical protein FCK22_17210 [Sulfitobacter sp. 15WGC]
MSQVVANRPKSRNDRQQKGSDTAATNPAPSACDIALEGMIVLLARHISREMTSVDEPQKMASESARKRIGKFG